MIHTAIIHGEGAPIERVARLAAEHPLVDSVKRHPRCVVVLFDLARLPTPGDRACEEARLTRWLLDVRETEVSWVDWLAKQRMRP